MLRIAEVHVGDYVDYAAVGLLGQTLVLAAVTGLHVEDGDVEAFGGDGRQTRVGVAENEQGVGLDVGHQLVGAVYDVSYGGSEIVAHGIHVDLGVGETEVFEKHAVEVVVVILAGMSKNHVEIFAALVDCGREPDDLGPCAHDYQQLQPAVVGKMYVFVISFHNWILYRKTKNRDCVFMSFCRIIIRDRRMCPGGCGRRSRCST